MSRMTPWLTALFAIVWLPPMLANDAGVDSTRAEFTEINIGFDGVYKVGHWTPIAVDIEAGDGGLNGRLEIQTLDGDEAATIVRGPNIRVSAGERYRAQALFKPGRPQAPLTIRVVNDGGDLIVERTFADVAIPKALLATQTVMVELGGRIGLDELEKQYEPDHSERVVAVASEIAALPDNALGYEGVDVVVIATSNQKTQHEWSAEHIAALDRWVQDGGTLIICVGGNGESVLASDSPLARFAPGEFDSVVNRGPGAWESFAGALSEPMTARGGGRVQPIRTTVLKNVRGETDHGDGIPLVVRTPRGFGTVIFAAADLDQPPFADWSARGKLLLRLLERQDPQAEATAARESALLSTRLGYTDVSGQLRSALDRFDGVEVVSFFVVALLGLAYLLLLFPLEYLLVRRGGRFGLTWVTFPLLLVGAGAGTWWFAYRSKGDQVRVNRLDIVDIDLDAGDVRGNTYFGLFSPATRKYDLSIQPSKGLSEPGSTRLSWFGLPGAGLGGMNSTVINPTSFEQPYQFGGDRLEGLPLAQWSSKSFQATWGRAGDELRNASTSDVTSDSAGSFLGERSADRQPLGTIVNRTGLHLRDCVLFYAGWAYPLGDLPAQPANAEKPSSASLSRPSRSMTIHAYLTDRRVIGEKEQSAPYDPASDDLTRIARMLMFYDSAGGRRYTSLSDRYFDSLDMTGLLRLGRAVLLARGPAATKVIIQSDGAGHEPSEESLAFFRFVIPVRRGLSSDEAEQATAELVFPHADSNADGSR